MKKMRYLEFNALLAFMLCVTGCGNTTNTSTSSSSSSEKVLHETEDFENPVFGCGADPSIIRGDDGYFYAYPTEASFEWIPGQEKFFSCGPILKSKNLTQWEYAGAVFDKKPTWSRAQSGTPGVWAPDIVFRNNKYYYYYSLGIFSGDIRGSGIGVAVSDYPAGPFVDYGKVLDGYDVSNHNCIDACVREDEDGKLYMFFGSYTSGIDVIELTDDGLKPKHTDQVDFGMKHMFGDSSLGGTTEGTYIIKMRGKYYFLGSGGSCCQGLDSTYYTICGRSNTMLGDYVDEFGNVLNDDTDAGLGSYVITSDVGNAKGTGHVSVIEDDEEEYWLVYHAYDSLDNNGQRKLMIDHLTFDETGFPHVENYTSTLGRKTRSPYIKNIDL